GQSGRHSNNTLVFPRTVAPVKGAADPTAATNFRPGQVSGAATALAEAANIATAERRPATVAANPGSARNGRTLCTA
ncbi:MAG TPA: hypothetical protein VG960_03030, partial [Caulobacteraceae bacterium]|nr:hypothetical protein [Caulobacteraceae bacterium]